MVLNEGQQKAAEEFFEFLMSSEKEMILSGGGGYGKTFLLGHLIDDIIPQYHDACKLLGIPPIYNDVTMTATTNKAAETLAEAVKRPVATVHSFLGLQVRDDYTTGDTYVTKGKAWAQKHNMILVVDEGYTLDTQVRKLILETLVNCKVLYVGDHCQLPPTKEKVSPIHTSRLRTSILTEPMRNKGNPHLMDLCEQLRDTVETGNFYDIQVVPGNIMHVTDDELLQIIEERFLVPDLSQRILAYTNKRVKEFNDHIRTIRQLPDHYETGELVVCNSAAVIGGKLFRAEEPITIESSLGYSQEELPDGTVFDTQQLCIRGAWGGATECQVPLNREYFESLVKYYAKLKQWPTYFHLKNSFPDLRAYDALTTHKAQGSTYNTVIIDLTDLSTCHRPDLFSKLLYVACTRPTDQIIFHGELAPKYGRLVN